MWTLLALNSFPSFHVNLLCGVSPNSKKKKNSGGGDVGKAVQGKKGLESPGLFFFLQKRTSEGLTDGRNCGPLRKKEKPPYLVFFNS